MNPDQAVSIRAFILFAVVVAIVAFWYFNQQGVVPPVSGIVGTVRSTSTTNDTFEVSNLRILNDDSLRFGTIERIGVDWGGYTKFFLYPTKEAAKNNEAVPAKPADVAAGQRVVISPYQKMGNVVNAREVYILPE
jgi:hypothetical protein